MFDDVDELAAIAAIRVGDNAMLAQLLVAAREFASSRLNGIAGGRLQQRGRDTISRAESASALFITRAVLSMPVDRATSPARR